MADKSPTLDPGTIRLLLRLRVFLEHALILADDTSEFGRQSAIVALDGVCEFATTLSAEHHSFEYKLGKWESPLEALQQLADWRREGERGVRALHQVRNLAQHQVTLPDAESMQRFAADAELFVRSLVESAFGIELATVRLAEAIVDPVLRHRIAEGEGSLVAGDFVSAFESVVEAFTHVRRRWRSQQQDAYGYMSDYMVLDTPPQWVNESGRAEDYADVAVFGADLGEYHALLATRRQLANGIEPNREDVERSLIFAFDWIVRWQRFDARYPRRRWVEDWNARRPPATNEGSMPAISEVRVGSRENFGGRVRDRIDVQLQDVPRGEVDDWGSDFVSTVPAIAKQVGLEALSVEAGPNEPRLGEFTFWTEPGLQTERIAEVVEGVLSEMTMAYRRRHHEVAERGRDAQIVADTFAEVLRASAPELFGTVTGHHEIRTEGEVVALYVEVLASPDEMNAVSGVWSSRGGVLADTAVFGMSQLTFSAFDLHESNRETLSEAAQASADQVEHLRTVKAAEAAEQAQLQAALSNRFGRHPGENDPGRPHALRQRLVRRDDFR